MAYLPSCMVNAARAGVGMTWCPLLLRPITRSELQHKSPPSAALESRLILFESCQQTFLAAIIGSCLTTHSTATRNCPTPRLIRDVHSNMSCTSDRLVQSLERERLAIWSQYPTEQVRQHVWAERKAQLVSYLVNDASAPRSIQQDLDGSTRALGVETGRRVWLTHLKFYLHAHPQLHF